MQKLEQSPRQDGFARSKSINKGDKTSPSKMLFCGPIQNIRSYTKNMTKKQSPESPSETRRVVPCRGFGA